MHAMDKIGKNKHLQRALDARTAALTRGSDEDRKRSDEELDRLLGTRSRSTDALVRWGVRSYDPDRKADNEVDDEAPINEASDAPEEAPTVEMFIARFDPACTRQNGGIGGFGPGGKSRAAGNREIAQAMQYAPRQALAQIYNRNDAGFMWAVVSGSNVTTPGGIPPHLRCEAVLYSNVRSIGL